MDRLTLLRERKRDLNNVIKIEKYKAHKKYFDNHKKLFLFLDLLVIITMLFNFGAITITNMLVIKIYPDKPLFEANPLQCKFNGYMCTYYGNSTIEMDNQPASLINSFFINGVFWVAFLMYYVWYRKSVTTDSEMMMLTFIVIFYFIFLTIDFFWDYGFYLGKILYA